MRRTTGDVCGAWRKLPTAELDILENGSRIWLMPKSEFEQESSKLGEAVREAIAGVHDARGVLNDAFSVLQRARTIWIWARKEGIQGRWPNSTT